MGKTVRAAPRPGGQVIDIDLMPDRMETMIRAGDDAERSDEEERCINPAGDDAERSNDEERRP